MRRGVVSGLAAVIALALAGCSRGVDRDEASLCRLAAVGLSAPSRVRIEAQAVLPPRGGAPEGIRLALTPADSDDPFRFLECRFAGGGGARPDLVSLATPSGLVDETHLYLLKRFWLGSDEAAGADPDLESEGTAALPALPIAAAYLLQQSLDALPNAAAYSLLAAAYSLVYGLYGRINLAFGSIAATGAFAAVTGSAIAAQSAPAMLIACATLLASWAAGWHGIAMERTVLWRLRAATGQQSLVATIGLALFIEEYLRLATGSQPRWTPPVLAEPIRLAHAGDFVTTVTPLGLILTAGTACASTGLLLMFRYTRFGLNWRAAADDPLAASLVGVDPRALSMGTYGLASALVGVAGAAFTLQYGSMSVAFTTGLGLKALIAAVLGGIGSVPGAFVGGAAVALVEAGWSAYFPIGDRDLVVDALLIAMLIWRPGGLLGHRDLVPRRA